MNEFALHPNVFASGNHRGLISMLENIWVRDRTPGQGSFYLISGFANYNGGVRFYDTFKNHIDQGGHIYAYFGGSTAQKLTSQQVVEALLGCGVEVNIINRKRILHAKLYGRIDSLGERLVVSSGNFTGPGMSQNVEGSVMLDSDTVLSMGFSWESLVEGLNKQRWEIYRPSLQDRTSPAWNLLYDEVSGVITLDETQEVTMVLTLGHNDVARIQAAPGSNASLGTQYFWLSRDCYDFFPALTIRNNRGIKTTYSTLIKLYYVDLNILDRETRVTFEAENNLDFRLGTGKLRYTRLANEGDLAVISRVGEDEYELRIARQGTEDYRKLSPYAINFIGHRGKRFGFLSNQEFGTLLNLHLPTRSFN
jgi:hypothetical protein